MLEVVFGDSAAGSLQQALAGEPREVEQMLFFYEEAFSPEEEARVWEEARRWQQEEEARQHRGWAEGLPMAGSPGDIMSLPLYLSVGEITKEGIGPQRQAAIESLMGTYPSMAQEVAEELLQRSRESLAAILARAGGGEGVRVWTSDTPDEACGLAWLVHQLASSLDLQKVQVTQVKLPEFYERPDGTVVQWRTWGEMDPWLWGRMVGLGQRLPVNLLRGLDARWQALQRENAPLRAVVNGELVSVPETWYDPFLWREIAAEGEEFMAARVVGNVLGKYRLGIGDSELAQRLQAMVQAGQLQQVTYPGPEDPIYHCRLRKTPGVWNK